MLSRETAKKMLTGAKQTFKRTTKGVVSTGYVKSGKSIVFTKFPNGASRVITTQLVRTKK